MNSYYVFNIGKPYTDDWWVRNQQLNIITAGYDGEPGDRGDIILHQLEENDWVIAYANSYGYIGAGLAGPSSTYQLISDDELPDGWESNHCHRRQVNWVYAVELSDAISINDVGHHAPRQTKEALPNDVGFRLVQLLARSCNQTPTKVLAELQAEFSKTVQESLNDRREARIRRLEQASKLPQRLPVIAYEFIRNPDVVAEVLEQANGICQRCGAKAPFVRQSNGTPYLEVHHKEPLAVGGEDSVANAIALCPNCHRELHYGVTI